MSNTTQHSRQPGDSRRRRSRGGKNRNNNQRGGERGSREGRGSGSGRAEEFRPQAPRPPRTYAPVKLTWWQKLLKAVGLYKEPAPPARRERKTEPTGPKAEARAPKSNVRNARSGEGGAEDSSGEGAPKRGNRGERGDRGGERGARGGESRSRGGDRSSVESTRVYVGNLSYDVTEQDLQELFKGIGGVRNVEIVYNRSTHRSKGYGFVEMLHKDDACRAVEVLHDQPFMGRKLTVSGAKSKGLDEREEKEDRPEREPRPVVLAPLPAPAAVAAEPEIQTIVETVTEAPAVEAPAVETPVAEAAPAEAPEESAPKHEVA